MSIPGRKNKNCKKSQVWKESLKGRNVVHVAKHSRGWGERRRTGDGHREDAFRSNEKLLTCLVTEIMT